MTPDQTARLARLLLDQLSANLELGDLTFKHMRYLMRVAEAEEAGKRARASDIAKEMDLQPSNASRIVSDLSGHSKRLVKPLLRVEIDPENRRHRLLSLTTTAKQQRKRNKQALVAIVDAFVD